jgi:hypothetical protein
MTDGVPVAIAVVCSSVGLAVPLRFFVTLRQTNVSEC